jgi:tetratricopeptide (TPR) repeat protein
VADEPDGAAPSGPGIDPAAMTFALGAQGVLDPRAAAYLEAQIRVAHAQEAVLRLQAEDLREKDAYDRSHLSWRRFDDWMRGVFYTLAILIGLFVVTLLGATVWTAAHDNSLVIEAFSVPPDFAQRGLTGRAVAAQVQDDLAAMQQRTLTARPADSYSDNWGNDIKVQIPETGVSIGEFYRLLVSWLGNRTHITGEIYRTGTGLALAVRASGKPGDTLGGRESDVGALLQKGAESIYARTQPYRYANYLLSVDPYANGAKANAIWDQLVQTGSPLDKAWSYMGLGTRADFTDPLHSAAIYSEAIPLVPDFALTYQNVASAESKLGHEQASLDAGRKVVSILRGGSGGMSVGAGRISLPVNRGANAGDVGDFAVAFADNAKAAALPDYAGLKEFARTQMVFALASLHDVTRARASWSQIAGPKHYFAEVNAAIVAPAIFDALGDWHGVLAAQAKLEHLLGDARQPPFTQAFAAVTLSRQVWPFAALALAHTGDRKAALALIAKTPADCDICLRMRGRIAALDRDWAQAARWFAIVAARSPAIPFADTDWGAMLLQKGDDVGAIAKFKRAHKISPHFADPLEMWGEALIAKNRSDLALAKFADAAKDAPNWGRLHLKWGEALLWSGDKKGAAKQFATAAHLDLTPAEKAELTKQAGDRD